MADLVDLPSEAAAVAPEAAAVEQKAVALKLAQVAALEEAAALGGAAPTAQVIKEALPRSGLVSGVLRRLRGLSSSTPRELVTTRPKRQYYPQEPGPHRRQIRHRALAGHRHPVLDDLDVLFYGHLVLA